MMRFLSQHLILIVLATVPLIASESIKAAEPRVLMIGIDGLRSDALEKANTPNIDKLITAGVYSPATWIHSDRFTKSDTVSGPGWTTYLTGVWADKHGVLDNNFVGRNSAEFPHIFVRMREAKPALRFYSGVDWDPLTQYVASNADVDVLARIQGEDKTKAYSNCDDQLSYSAAGSIASGEIDVAFIYFGAVDETGHKDGFHPSVPSYVSIIEKTDERIGRLLKAIEQRPHRIDEDWLVLVGTDHGGRGTGHGGNRNVAEVCQVPLIVSGPAAAKSLPSRRIESVDLVACAVAHLGISAPSQWGLDGSEEGLVATAQATNE